MSKVAICIAGEMRYWEITKNVFNSFDADIFISTWDTNDRQDNYPYKFHGNKNINNEIVDGLDNLIEAEFLPKEIESKFTFNIPKYWYLIHRCNILKNKQEVKENFKYDCVIVTRPDNVIEKNIIRKIPKKLDELYVYSSKISPSDETFGFQTMDSLSFGTSSTMDIYSSLYKHIYMSEDYNVIPMGHSLIPFYMKYIGLNMSDKEITHDMINKIRKPKQYEKLKGEYNV
tara:strand:+ start:1484 stop:2173 length:690 start_codon:yes stop_codon:yes gene_type:complete